MPTIEGASNFTISDLVRLYEVHGNAIIDYIPDTDEQKKNQFLSIVNLPRAHASQKADEPSKKIGPCFPGTRETLLLEMLGWAFKLGESRMYILSGQAGIGKSTVAYTLATQMDQLRILGASFFFSRDKADRKDAEKFFSTIAYQLCAYDEAFAAAIADVLLTERGSASATQNPHEQLRTLILEPLPNIERSHTRPILIIVDALDECDEEDALSVLTGLRRLVQALPSFKVILTTRPHSFVQGDHQNVHLQDIEDKIVDSDIRLYLRHNLSIKQVQKHYPKRKWCASDEEINCLVQATGRFFIIASTAVRFIFDKSVSDPEAQLQKLRRSFTQELTPFKDLDHFYSAILPTNCDEVSRYQTVIGTIIFIQRHLPVSVLAHLTNMELNDIYSVLNNLQSVISLDDDEVPRVYHKSFIDYIANQTRFKNSCLWINPKICHVQIATRCFEIMNKHLKYNILGLGIPARFMNNEDGLKEARITDKQLQERIPQQLRYACVYWIDHLRVATIDDAGIMNGLKKFVHEHLLYCFEVLSWIEQLDSARRAIYIVLKLLKATPLELHKLFSDAMRFISRFYDTIRGSALHTYYSALPFTPTDSLLYQRYNKGVASGICGIEGGPEKWDVLIATLNHNEFANIIKFSLDGALFVSCSEKFELEVHNYFLPLSIRNQGKLKIWDANTGRSISTISGHRFAIANDFSTFASSEDKTITFYDMNGSARGSAFSALQTIEKLALSCESSRVSAGLSDGTVLLWESKNVILISTFDGLEIDRYEDNMEGPQLRFSPTGTRLAYASANGTVKLRDGISGRFVAELQCGSKRVFKFSGDGSRIASLSPECGLSLWDSGSGRLIGNASSGGQMLAISANGSLLATVDDDDGLKLWREQRGSPKQIEVLGLKHTVSMNFSRNNILAIATMIDIQLYDVNTRSSISTFSLRFPICPIVLDLSPDSTRLAVGYFFGGSVGLWDAGGIDAPTSSTEDLITVTALVLSQDCSRLACGFLDGTVELWETSGPKQRIALHQHYERFVRALGFSPDGTLFASGWRDGTVKLLDGKNGLLRGTLRTPNRLLAVALSTTILVVGHHNSDVTLWNLDTLGIIHTFKISGGTASTVSIAENNAFVAVVGEDSKFSEGRDFKDTVSGQSVVSVLDVLNRTTIATFDVPHQIHTTTFLPDNSQLVAQSSDGHFLSFNLSNERIIEGPTLEHLVQLPDIPLWHGVPVWHCQDKGQHYLSALFPRRKNPVSVLRIPKDLRVCQWTWIQGSSMIALGCKDGRVILLRLLTRYT